MRGFIAPYSSSSYIQIDFALPVERCQKHDSWEKSKDFTSLTHNSLGDDKREDLFIVLIIMTQGKTTAWCPLREPIDASTSLEQQ